MIVDEFIEIITKHTNYDLDYWDPDKFNWKSYSSDLCISCTDHFETWWDPDKFDWANCSWALCRYCSKYFEIWWDPDKFDWNQILYLVNHCYGFIDKWWIEDKIIKYGFKQDSFATRVFGLCDLSKITMLDELIDMYYKNSTLVTITSSRNLLKFVLREKRFDMFFKWYDKFLNVSFEFRDVLKYMTPDLLQKLQTIEFLKKQSSCK